ncbi:MAG: 30S ribosomal protein S1 [Flavobacteriales bacterium]|nr:30S ribosomal protein S1 [Flavobacteriales bacterium]MBL6873392.1 30S ribosomal protein S1 [Flavobacteriales bacterium]
MSEEKKTEAEKTTNKAAAPKKTTAKKTAAKKSEKVKPAEEVKVTEEVKTTEEVVQEAPAKEEAAVEETPAAEKVVTEEVVAEESKATEEETVEEAKEVERMTSAEEDKDFDWEVYEMGTEEYTNDERSDLEKDYESALSTIDTEQVLDGSVVSITDREVIVNINYKSDGIISRNEFRYNEDLKIGDSVEVLVEKKEDKKGQLILSHKKARVFRSWEKVNEAHDKDIVLEGLIKCRTKGGMIVEVLGLEAFLPGSQIDIKPIRDYDDYVGKKMEFKVVKINHEFRNVVVSHKALIEADLEEQKKEIMSKLEVGQILEGTVKNITSYGVFVDLGGIDGLIHITDLSWGRVNHPDEIVELDSTINVVILEFDDDKRRIQLGLKQLTSHPWDALDEKISIGDKINGKVVVVADYGAFVEVQPGIEALVHVSEMSWSTHLRSASDFLKIGQEIEAQVLTLDREDRKMSLGMKQLLPDPWTEIMSKFPVGSNQNVIVRNFTNFGIFVELEEGVDGLIHISDLSWDKKIKHPSEFTKVGEKIDAKVLEIDMESRKLSLGVKQLLDNPWDGYETIFGEGKDLEGEVKDLTKNGATIILTHGVEAFAPKRHLVKEDDSKVEVGDKLNFRVLEFSKDSQKIIVSHTVIFKEVQMEEVKSTKKKVQNVQKSQQKSTLGDMDELIALKESMDKKENKGK